MLEITISEGEKFLLKEAGFKDVISFCLLLSYGNIKNLQDVATKTVGNVTLSIQEQLNQLDEKKYDKVRIWYSAMDNEDVCTLYFLVSYFYPKNIEIQVCEVSNENHFSLGSYNADDIKALLEKTRILSTKEQKIYHENWQTLVNENSDLRILQKNHLISVPFGHLDMEMLHILKQYKNIRYWAFIGECMSRRLCGFYGDIFFIARIEELIKNEIVEICDVKKERNAFGEWKEQKCITIKEYEK